VIALLALALTAPTIHVHVDGDGYLRLVREGRAVYAKEAALTVVAGKLACSDGTALNPRIQIAADVQELSVALDGRVTGASPSGERELGRLVLAVFPEDVRLVVDGKYLVSSYRPELVDPGVGTAGVVRTGPSGAAPRATDTPTTTSRVEIVLHAAAEVEGRTFTLGQIAEVRAADPVRQRLESLEVSTTPALGASYRMSQDAVRLRILRSEGDADQYKFSGAAQVTVTQKGQSVTAAMFNEAALRAAASAGAGDKLVAESGGVDTVVPVGRLELVGENVAASGSRVSVRVAIVVDGTRINSRTVSLERGDAISKLRVGQTVKVLVKSGSAVVETTGRVRSIDAAAGTVVVTSATGADLIGKPVSSDTVEVVL
jgi:hypothetical protein